MRIALGILLLAPVAYAQSAMTADDFHRAGEAAYKSGDYAAAASAFEEAYKMNARPQTLFSLAQAYRQLYVEHHEPGVLLRAVELYRQYLAQVPRGGRSADAHELLANLDPLAQLVNREHPDVKATPIVAKTQVLVWSAIDATHARIDGGEPLELPQLVETTPGPHSLAFTAAGHADATVQITAVENQLVPIEGRLPVLPARLVIDTSDDADLVLDGVPRTLDRDPLSLAPGPHTLWFGSRGRTPQEREIMLAPGASERIQVSLSASPRRQRARWLYVAAGALAVSSLASFGYAHHRSNAAWDLYRIRDDRAWTPSEYDMYAGDRTAVNHWQTAGTGLAITSALVGALATWWWFDDVPTPHR
ncbi:MAG TPA: hypothetical protein VGM39_03245 [Kofleriaceae bacterium]|jgi:tetratricopeptide (TPR) repeat protein